jgi:hypothetical protein
VFSTWLAKRVGGTLGGERRNLGCRWWGNAAWRYVTYLKQVSEEEKGIACLLNTTFSHSLHLPTR